MYHIFINVYAMFVNLLIENCQQSNNVIVIILKSHDLNFNDVITCFDINIKTLNRDCIFNINDWKQHIWTPMLTYLENMKQQQMSVGFLDLRANRCCRFCDANVNKWVDLSKNIVFHGCYHYQTVVIQKKNLKISTKTKRIQYFSHYDFKSEISALQRLILNLNLIMICSSNFIHSEYYDLMWKLYFIFFNDIFILKTVDEFISIFQQFLFSPNWDRIQSPTIHMKSWILNECDKAFVIISIIFCCWFKLHHMRPAYFNKLKIQSVVVRPLNLSLKKWIVSCFANITKNNILISSYRLSVNDKKKFQNWIVHVRKCFLVIINATIKSQFKNKTEFKPKKMNDWQRLSMITMMVFAKSVSDLNTNVEKINQENRHFNADINSSVEIINDTVDDDMKKKNAGKLLNFHININFKQMIKKYGILWNINVLFEKNKHRMFKKYVLLINHRNVKKQFFLKKNLFFIVKVIINDVFCYINIKLFVQFHHLLKRCFELLKNFIWKKNKCEKNSRMLMLHTFLSSNTHSNVSAFEKYKWSYLKKHNFLYQMMNADNTF